MNILLACDNSSILNTILFIKRLIDIIFIVAPIILSLLLTLDIAKNVMNKDDSENKKNINIAVKRIIYCIALFFVPLIIDSVMSYLDSYNVNFAKCYDKATEENVQKYYDEETKRDEERQAEIDKSRADNAKKVSEETIKEEEDSKKAASSASKKKSQSSSSNANVPNQYVQAKKIAEAAGGGSSCSDGHMRNCKLGDQTGKEVRFSKWRGGWSYVLRANDPKKANLAAKCMEDAVNNNNIGYGQQGFSQWSMLWNYLSKRGDWDVSTVNKKVSVSCCPLVAVCLKYAGFNPSKALNCQPGQQKNMKAEVYKSGSFSQVYPGKSLNLSNIRRGDVLIHYHHMAMAV